jgi:hypothetical protein
MQPHDPGMRSKTFEIVTTLLAIILTSTPAKDPTPILTPHEVDSVVATTPAQDDIPPEISTQVAPPSRSDGGCALGDSY